MAKRKNYERQRTIPILKFSLELYYKGGFYYKPPDIFVKSNALRFTDKKPFDIFYIYNGETVGIEAKYIGNDTFKFASVAEHQVENLISIANTASGYLAIHHQVGRKEHIAFIEIYDFLHLQETYYKKSMRWEEILQDDHFSFILEVESYDVGPGDYRKYVNFYGTYLLDE